MDPDGRRHGSGSVAAAAWHVLDLRDPDRIEAVMAEVNPQVVVNATSGDADWAVTAEGPIRVAMSSRWSTASCRLPQTPALDQIRKRR